MQRDVSQGVLHVAAAIASLLAACGSPARDGVASPSLARTEASAQVTEGSAPLLPESAASAEGLSPALADFGGAVDPSNEGEVCAAVSGESELRRLYLAFALDVSASMGSDEQRFRLKWQPVVQASEAFFSEAESAGVSASLTFFPGENAAARCSDAAYTLPSVPRTLLPSNVFSQAITGLALTPGGNWRTSTPTSAAFGGIAASLASGAQLDPGALSAIVLVTDGVPQGCSSNDNDLQLLVDAVRNSGVLTFVVGVGNPAAAGPADNLANLNLIAEAGGTSQAFIIETGNAAQTEADFKAVVDSIRGVALPCAIEIPLPPAGAQFIPERINVSYLVGGRSVALSHDPECRSPGSWRYDDPSAPDSIVLCDDTCGTARQEVSARISIEFGCERRNVIR
jgi:von Willebrand factor type A domain